MEQIVSVIITTHKRSYNVLYRAIASVLSQSYDKFELIIIDDSPKSFPERKSIKENIERLKDDRIRYFQNNTNIGACASRNRGVSLSKGEYIAFLDDDDEWYPNKLEKQICCFEKEDIGIVYCNVDLYYDDTQKTIIRNKSNDAPIGDVFNRLFTNNVIGSTSFPMIRRKSFDEVKGFDESMPALQDWDLWLRITKNSKVFYISEVLGKYHFYKGDRLSNNSDKRLRGYLRIREKHMDYLNKNEMVKSQFDMVATFFYSNNKQILKALKYWMLSVKQNPLNIKWNLQCLIKAIVRSIIKVGIK